MDEALDDGAGRARDSLAGGPPPAAAFSVGRQSQVGTASGHDHDGEVHSIHISRRRLGRRHGQEVGERRVARVGKPSPCASNGHRPHHVAMAMHSAILSHLHPRPGLARAPLSLASATHGHGHSHSHSFARSDSSHTSASGLVPRRAPLHLCPRMLMRQDEGTAARHMCDAVGEVTVKARS